MQPLAKRAGLTITSRGMFHIRKGGGGGEEGVQFNHRFPSAFRALPVTAAAADGAVAVRAVGGRTDPANGDLIVISAKEERSLFSPGAKEEREKGGKRRSRKVREISEPDREETPDHVFFTLPPSP